MYFLNQVNFLFFCLASEFLQFQNFCLERENSLKFFLGSLFDLLEVTLELNKAIVSKFIKGLSFLENPTPTLRDGGL